MATERDRESVIFHITLQKNVIKTSKLLQNWGTEAL